MGGGGKESPRQKMIGMMYLVLTALLAMNVTDQVLNAFMKVNEGLKATNANFDTKNQFSLTAFESAMKNNPGKTKPFYDKAKLAQKYSEELNEYIMEIQKELHEFGEFDEEKQDYEQKKDYDKVGEIMVGEVGPKKGPELKKRILETRKKLYDLLDEKGKKDVVLALNAIDPTKAVDGNLAKTWESATFEGVPLVAGMALLSKIQNDIKNAEADVINYMLKSIDANDFKFDKLNAVAVAKTSYLLVGQPYEAEVFLTASDSKKDPEISVGGSRLQTEEGRGKYAPSTGKAGFFKWKGIINVKKPDGTMEQYETPEVEYQVAEPSVNVSPDKMNVFYIGVDNPITVSGAGIAKEKISATIDGQGSLRKDKDGSYIASVTTPGKVKVNVFYEPKPGERKNLGSKEFRVKKIPDPIAKFAGTASGRVNAATLRNQKGVIAALDNFDFEAKFQVIKFSLGVTKKSGDYIGCAPAKDAYLTEEMKSALEGLRPKEKVFIDEITVREPGGGSRKLQTGITIEVQ